MIGSMIETDYLPPPDEIWREIPLSEELAANISRQREELKAIFHRQDSRLALVVGPCSIHNIDSALLYAQKLQALARQIDSQIAPVMRVYIEKPRTTTGWKGLMYDPFLNGTNDIESGIRMARMALKQIAEEKVAIAAEFLDPIASLYFSDLVSWGFIGARTSSCQIHRQLVSGLPMLMGFKNTVDGNLETALHSIIASRASHNYFTIGADGHIAKARSFGNTHTHLVLRGSMKAPNYNPEFIHSAYELQNGMGIHAPILVDCSHDNSNKIPARQEISFRSVIRGYTQQNTPIFGAMIESFLEEGNQPIDLGGKTNPYLSVTDPCLGWENTKDLLLWASDTLANHHQPALSL